MRVLITGGLGFIGRHLQARLLQEPGTKLLLLDREANALKLEGTRVSYIQADLRDYDALRRILETTRPEVIFHLAAAGVGDPFLDVAKALNHNLYGTLNLLRAAFAESAATEMPQRIVISRTPGEYSAMNPYAASKAAAWQFCRMYARTNSWPIVGAAIFQAYGPGQPVDRLLPSAIQTALAGEDFPMTAGDQERDWIYISDVILGLLAARDANLAPGTTIELGSGQMTSLAAMVKHVFAITGGPGRPLLGALPSRPGEDPFQRARAQETYELTGWRTTVSAEEGLSTTIAEARAGWQPNLRRGAKE